MNGKTWTYLVIGLVLAATASDAFAQTRPAYYDFVRRDLDWFTIETEHFKVHFHADDEGAGSSRTAQVVARIAEDIYAPITSLYEYEPDTKVSFILKDFEDYSNGAAYFFDNMIEIWAPALDSPLRGDHNWLRNVITHEFTHIVQVQKTMKASRRMPFLYFQLLDYEDVRRPDVLYGYPNVIATYPVPVLNNPAWLAEGTAQYQRAALNYDRWDTHRDMLLRTRVLAGEEIALEDMGGFYSHTSLGRESVYNHGFAFSHYLANTYGEEALRDVSASLGKWRNWNFERAAKDALGVDGGDLWDDWMEGLRYEYAERTLAIREHTVGGELVEPEGFSNFYPRYSPDGTRLAYLSNRGEDFNLMALYIHDFETGETAALDVDGLYAGPDRVYTCALGHRVTSGTSGAFDWRPDGKALVYARIKDNRAGSRFSDLYLRDLDTDNETRLTTDARAAAPAFAPDGTRLVFIEQRDGSTHLALFDLETKAVTRLTHENDGTQVTEPRWHPSGEWIYFGRLTGAGRDLYRIRADGTALEPVRATAADERSPAFDPSGDFLYFASDETGIFNLYRVPFSADAETGGRGDAGTLGEEGEERASIPQSAIQNPQSDEQSAEQLTNVVGGAFMPNVGADGSVAFARYGWDGYKIARLAGPAAVPAPARALAYVPPPITQKTEALAEDLWEGLNTFNDTDLRPLKPNVVTTVRTEGSFPLGSGASTGAAPETVPEGEEREVKKYGSVFTSFSFFPVLRLDQYVSRQRSNAQVRLPDRTYGSTLLRNTKAGVYVTSREILNGLTMLGGVLVGPASREDVESVGDYLSPSNLLKLERDLFIQFEYKKGFGILPQRWSPQLSVELFNIRRNVENGLTIEEFPCTACFPDTTLADIAYNLWELNFAARSKVTRSLLLEAGYRVSPYRVTTERFFSKEFDQSIAESSARYFIGQAYRLKAYYEAFHPDRDGDVVARGLRAEATYEYEPGRLLDRFDVEDGLLRPIYERFKNHRLTLDARYGFHLPGAPRGGAHGIGLRVRGSTLLGAPVDDFFDDYVGGLIGARGYPFYALGGNETIWMQASYTFPIFPRVEKQLGFAYLDKVYARLYTDAALAWSGPWPGLDGFRKDVGAELRLGMASFYLLPTSVFLSATYGLDAFDFQLDEGFVTPDGSSTVRYGQDVLWHLGILFEFDAF